MRRFPMWARPTRCDHVCGVYCRLQRVRRGCGALSGPFSSGPASRTSMPRPQAPSLALQRALRPHRAGEVLLASPVQALAGIAISKPAGTSQQRKLRQTVVLGLVHSHCISRGTSDVGLRGGRVRPDRTAAHRHCMKARRIKLQRHQVHRLSAPLGLKTSQSLVCLSKYGSNPEECQGCQGVELANRPDRMLL